MASNDEPLPLIEKPPLLHHGLPASKRATICRYLLLGWRNEAIASEAGVSIRTVQRIQTNLLRYGSVRKPRYRTLGRARKISEADKKALFEYLLKEGWRQQGELVWWLYHERDVSVSQPTVSRLLQREKWTRKNLRRIARARNEELRRLYLDDIRQFVAEDLVFLDESIFNEKTGWRYHGYAPRGDEAIEFADISRGRTWAICSAMTLDGWLPCTGIKEGYFKEENFFQWLQDCLLPALALKNRTMVVVLDNVCIHIKNRIAEVVEAAGHLIRYLPPYSPDYNPIELTFSVLKAWMKRNWVFLRPTCSSYGEFLELAIKESRCDRFARKQFRHAGGEGVYIEEAELERFIRYMEAGEDLEAI